MKKIAFTTCYDTSKKVCGYIIPQRETDLGYEVNTRQYRRALSKRTIGGIAGIEAIDGTPIYCKNF